MVILRLGFSYLNKTAQTAQVALHSTVEMHPQDQGSQKNLMNLSFCQSFATGGAHVLGIDGLLDAVTAEYMTTCCGI